MNQLALRAAAAQSRAQAGLAQRATPRDRPEAADVRFTSQLRAKKTVRDDGLEYFQVEGYASVYERGYEMWDWYGPYTEVVSLGAAEKTLSQNPEVVFRFNHAGTPMAGTRNGRLELWEDSQGLGQRAFLNPKRSDVQLLVQAIEDDDVREQSFQFRITRGVWSPDYTEYRIEEFDLDRGDVGPVTFGANPHTSVAARSGEFLASIPSLPPLVAREAYTLLGQRPDLAAARTQPAPAGPPPAPTPVPVPAAAAVPQGRSLSLLTTQLLVAKAAD
ncbi:HK97 family phage prohead protease [Kitasatospora sp. NPDC002551]|uniref:HK97 family phage prohead protease n=1 Tax=Kitasatospora sp. NPDC002551 TaxID=3154539 RepID=UPI0033208CBD